MSKPDIIKQLSAKIRQLERPQSKADSEFHETVTGINAFDALLPAGGLTGGTMIEWLSPQGGGGSTLATILAARILTENGTMVVIDSLGEFYPPAFTNLGISLQQIVIIRPNHIGQALWAFEQSLRCSGVTITMAWIDHITDQTFRRLQLATEAGGGVGFLIRPSRFFRQRSWADARLLVEPVMEEAEELKGERVKEPAAAPTNKPVTSPPFGGEVGLSGPGEGAANLNKGVGSLFSEPPEGCPTKKRPNLIQTRRLKVQLLHCRGRIDGGQVELEINDETGDVHLASKLATPTAQHRKAGA
jgi:protein ImuA